MLSCIDHYVCYINLNLWKGIYSSGWPNCLTKGITKNSNINSETYFPDNRDWDHLVKEFETLVENTIAWVAETLSWRIVWHQAVYYVIYSSVWWSISEAVTSLHYLALSCLSNCYKSKGYIVEDLLGRYIFMNGWRSIHILHDCCSALVSPVT